MMLGNYRGELEPGTNIVTPFVSAVHTVDMREKNRKFSLNNAVTADKKKISLKADLYLKVKDAERAHFEVDDHEKATAHIVRSALLDEVTKWKYDELRFNRTKLVRNVLKKVKERTEDWGVEITSLEIEPISP